MSHASANQPCHKHGVPPERRSLVPVARVRNIRHANKGGGGEEWHGGVPVNTLKKVPMFSSLLVLNVAFVPRDLTVEYLEAPLGVDVAAPRFSWKIVPDKAWRGRRPAAYHLQVSTDGFQTFAWDSGRVNASTVSLVPYNGTALSSDTIYSWRVRSWLDDGSAGAFAASSFRTGLLSRSEWSAAWITGGDNATLLRKEFALSAPPVGHATLFVAGLGYSEVELDGEPVSDHKLGSGWTDYNKRVVYSTIDITALLAAGDGKHALGVSLGNGWFSCGPPPGTGQPACHKSPPMVLLEVRVDGRPVAVSDLSWKVGASPITYNSLYNGEAFDGRRAAALAGWSSTGFDDSRWAAAAAAKSSARAVLSSALFEPTRHLSRRAPVSITSPAPHVQVFDFGQNLAGVVSLRGLRCESGQRVTIRHAELLTHPPYGAVDGSIYVGNLRTAKATDVYTCRGDPGEAEEFTPTFTQHGFRYAEVSGLLKEPLAASQVSAVEMHTAIVQHSTVGSSDARLNRMQQAILWGQKTNVMSGVPTDCPNRDERKGWTGDTALTAEEAAHNFGMGAVYTRWLLQFGDDQLGGGATTDFVPATGWSRQRLA